MCSADLCCLLLAVRVLCKVHLLTMSLAAMLVQVRTGYTLRLLWRRTYKRKNAVPKVKKVAKPASEVPGKFKSSGATLHPH